MNMKRMVIDKIRRAVYFTVYILLPIIGGGWVGVSCSDDENNGGTTPGVKRGLTEAQLMQRIAVASVLNKLTGETFSDTTDVDFEGRTYEPTIGVVRNESRPSERSIQVSSASLAEGYFRSLAGGASELITETDDGCKIDLTDLDCHSTGRKQSLGTLTFHNGYGANDVGYADVDIPSIPSLQRISYKTDDQWGDNGDDGDFKSPITKGEVFVGGGGRYWICVRVATGNNYEQSGVLINMQSGKGDDWKPIYEDEKWAAWEPADYIIPDKLESAVLDYVQLCGAKYFHNKKEKIMKQSFGSKVFPDAWGWNLNGHNGRWELWQYNDPGFGTLDVGYCHRAVYPPAERGIVIVMECNEGCFDWNNFMSWRRWRIYCTGTRYDSVHKTYVMANQSLDLTDTSPLHRVDYCYHDYNKFYWFPYFACIYTVRAITFTTQKPEALGLTKVNI